MVTMPSLRLSPAGSGFTPAGWVPAQAATNSRASRAARIGLPGEISTLNLNALPVRGQPPH